MLPREPVWFSKERFGFLNELAFPAAGLCSEDFADDVFGELGMKLQSDRTITQRKQLRFLAARSAQ